MKKLIIIRGISGSGKTTFAKQLKVLFEENGEKAVICEADDYFTDSAGKYVFCAKELSQAHKLCYNKFVKTLEANEIAIVSNTSCEKWEIEPYIGYVKERGIAYDIVYMNKYYGNIHGVPLSAIERMKQRYKKYEGEISSSDYMQNLEK